jgi:hypothetical protein
MPVMGAGAWEAKKNEKEMRRGRRDYVRKKRVIGVEDVQRWVAVMGRAICISRQCIVLVLGTWCFLEIMG